MKLLMLSGIFAQTPEYRASHMAETPDSLLADAMVEQGFDVTTAGPHFRGDWSGYDIVHLHHTTNACVRALLPVRPRIVFTSHVGASLRPVRELVRRGVERRADKVVVFTEDERRRLGGRLPDEKVEVIVNGIAVERFTPVARRAPGPDEIWDLLYVGQLVAFKRVHLALVMLRRVLASGRRARLRLVSHRDTLRPELEAEARRLGVAEHVEWLGARTRDEIGAEMNRSHVLLLPSEREGFSTVTSEAALCGLPVVLFDVAGSGDQTPEGWQRPHVDDHEGWYEAGLRLLDRYDDDADRWWRYAPVLREQLGVDRMVRRHVDMYERVLAG